MEQEDVVYCTATRDEPTLMLAYHVGQAWSKSVGNDLSNDLVNNIAKSYRPELCNLESSLLLRNERYASLVHLLNAAGS